MISIRICFIGNAQNFHICNSYGSSANDSQPPKLAALATIFRLSKNLSADPGSLMVKDRRLECPDDCDSANSCWGCDFSAG